MKSKEEYKSSSPNSPIDLLSFNKSSIIWKKICPLSYEITGKKSVTDKEIILLEKNMLFSSE